MKCLPLFKSVLLAVLAVCTLPVFAQDTLTGKVAGSGSHPLPGASITEKVTSNATIAKKAGSFSWKKVGQLKTHDAKDIIASSWSIGGDTLDRNFTDYQSCKKYLGPLGAKLIRFQGRWAKCEKVKGQYDFVWLDSIIPDAASRGVYPWVERSYGNPIYDGGGEAKLAGHIPTSQEALSAWDNWVKAIVARYKTYVPEWEIWNEPDLNSAHTGKQIGEFYVGTARIVRTIQPDAKLIAPGMASVTKLEFVKDYMEYLKASNALDFIDVLTYHGYAPNPSTSYSQIEKLHELVWSYKRRIVFMLGENEAPSFRTPVLAALITGQVYEIPKANIRRSGSKYTFTQLPVPDYPVIIAEKTLLQ